MKKFFFITVLAVMLVGVGAGLFAGGEAEGSETKRILPSDNMWYDVDLSDVVVGVSVGTMAQERWQREIAMFKEYAEQLGIKLLVQSAEDDASKQHQQVENLLSQGIDVLIAQPVDSEAAGKFCESAHYEDVKVIAYDRFINNGELDYCVGFDDVQVGEYEASMCLDLVSEGNYILLKGDVTTVNTHNLYIGNMNVLKPYIDSGDVTLVYEQYCKNWGTDAALQHTENALTANNNNIKGIICQNDTTALGAIQALEAQGLTGVPVSGQDCELSACQRIVEGTQTGSVYKPLVIMNTAALDVAIMIALGKDPKEFKSEKGRWGIYNNGVKDVPALLMDVIPVTKDNIMDTIITDGFHTMEEVFVNIPKADWPKQ